MKSTRIPEPELEQRARQHFEALTRDEQIEAVYRLADQGRGDHEIACATRWAVEEVRRVLGQRAAA